MRVHETGSVACPEIRWKEDAEIFFHVEIHAGGIFLYFRITGNVHGREEALNLFLLERAGDVPKRRADIGLALPVAMLPIFRAENISFAELFCETNGRRDGVAANLEKRLIAMFVERGTFCVERKGGVITFSVAMVSPRYTLSASVHLSELKKFCEAGPSE